MQNNILCLTNWRTAINIPNFVAMSELNDAHLHEPTHTARHHKPNHTEALEPNSARSAVMSRLVRTPTSSLERTNAPPILMNTFTTSVTEAAEPMLSSYAELTKSLPPTGQVFPPFYHTAKMRIDTARLPTSHAQLHAFEDDEDEREARSCTPPLRIGDAEIQQITTPFAQHRPLINTNTTVLASPADSQHVGFLPPLSSHHEKNHVPSENHVGS